MRRPLTASVLTPAERARTIVASATTLRVVAPTTSLDVHRHGVVPDGSLLFQAPGDFVASLGGDTVTATAVDVTTVPQADRLRGTLTLAGPVLDVVEPLPAGMRMHLTGSDTDTGDGSTRLVRLVPESVGLDWRCETGRDEPSARTVAVDDYRCAFPDPLLGYEAEWLPHLQADHAELLHAIARYELGWDEGPDDVRALGIDRFGFVLRVRDAALAGHRDLRISFDRSVTCGCDVRDAFATLLEKALPGAGPIC